MADERRKNVLLQLKEYPLCRYCLARQSGVLSKKPIDKCYICRGLLDNLDDIAKKALAAAKQYQFDTFLVGATLPTQLYDREDALRARLKIRGRENVKSQFTRELGQSFSRLTGKKVDYHKPDLMISFVVDKEGGAEATARARPLAIGGRYVKRARGLPQKQDRCPMCLGKCCNLCDNTGFDSSISVEAIIAKHLRKVTGGQAPKFSWVGSEDRDSLVLGRGRPFYARISDPKVRRPRKSGFKEDGVEVRITSLPNDVPDTHARFIVKTMVGIKCGRPLTSEDARKLRLLAGSDVKFESRSKFAAKKIYSSQAKIKDGMLLLTIKADGGLPIKQFVGGEEYIEPSISKLLNAKCECAYFDIFAVDIQ